MALLVPLIGCAETQHARYPTYADAEAAGAVRRGWIPPYVPPSAVEIVEAHDLDLNTQRLRFRVAVAELPRVIAGMEPLTIRDAWPPAVRSPELPGEWPGELSDRPVSARPSVRLYRAPEAGSGARCVAVETDRGMVYAWSCERRAS